MGCGGEQVVLAPELGGLELAQLLLRQLQHRGAGRQAAELAAGVELDGIELAAFHQTCHDCSPWFGAFHSGESFVYII
jgi:hypothetical protein